MSDQLSTSPIKLTATDRDLVQRVQAHYDGVSRHVLQRAAMRYGLRAALSDPACLGPHLVSPTKGVENSDSRAPRGARRSNPLAAETTAVPKLSKPTAGRLTAVEESELEDIPEDAGFAPNPFA